MSAARSHEKALSQQDEERRSDLQGDQLKEMPKQLELNAAASWISRITAAIIVIIALGLISISAWINYCLGTNFGRTTEDAMLYGTASAFISVLGVAMSFMVGHIWRQGRRTVVAVGSIIMLLCLSYSFTAAVGFTIGVRTHARDAQFLQAELNWSELTKLRPAKKILNASMKPFGCPTFL